MEVERYSADASRRERMGHVNITNVRCILCADKAIDGDLNRTSCELGMF